MQEHTHQKAPEKKDAMYTIRQLIMSTQETIENNIRDVFYIGEKVAMIEEKGLLIPKKHEIGRCYRGDFVLKNKTEAIQLLQKKHLQLPSKYNETDFFVYNEKTREINPFKKWDCLMYPGGYVTFDGKEYIIVDDNGNEIKRF